MVFNDSKRIVLITWRLVFNYLKTNFPWYLPFQKYWFFIRLFYHTNILLIKHVLNAYKYIIILQDNSIVVPDPWSLTSRPKSTSSLYEEELSRRPSLLLPPPTELNDLQMSPTSSDLPSEWTSKLIIKKLTTHQETWWL